MHDYRTVTDYKIKIGACLQFLKLSCDICRRCCPYIFAQNFLDPRKNYDFRKIIDRKKFYRDGEEYFRPFDWYRYALSVKV